MAGPEDEINPFMDEQDAEKLFDENKYTTLIINTAEFSEKNKERVKNLVSLLSSGERESKDEALRLLKEHDGKELLLEALSLDEFKSKRSFIVAACWESAMDFSKYFDFFLYLVLSADFAVAMEAVTVIVENTGEKLAEETLKLALEKLTEAIARADAKQVLYEDLMMNLKARKADSL